MHVYITEEEPTIEGSVSELKNIAECMKRAKIGFSKKYEMSQKATVSPYEGMLQSIIIDCNGSKIRGSIREESLILEFSEEYAEIMASYFEFDEASQAGAHWHFDQYGNEEYFDSECIDMVVQLAV